MKKEVIIILVIFGLLINVNFVSGLGTFVDSNCDGNILNYQLDGGGWFTLDCGEVMTNPGLNNFKIDSSFCQNDGILEYSIEGRNLDAWFSSEDRDIYLSLNPCDKCGIYEEDLLASCIGDKVDDERAIIGYPNLGRCIGATETYLGMVYVTDTYNYGTLIGPNGEDYLWDASYDWPTDEICDNNLDDDCDGYIDEQDVCGDCQNSWESCSIELVCCPGLSCENAGEVLGDICIDCLNEEDNCNDDLYCCEGSYCSENHCCPIGDEWDPIEGTCLEQTQCNIECSETPGTFAWYTNTFCMFNLPNPLQACCEVDLFGGEGWYRTNIEVY